MPCLRARLAEGHEEALKRELEAYQDNELKLQKGLTACRAEVDALTGKGARFDAIQSRLNAALEGYNEAKHRADATASALALCQAEKKDLSSSHTELLQKVELLQVDKIYLQKSAADATERMEQLRAEVRTRGWHGPTARRSPTASVPCLQLERARAKCRDLKQTNDTYANKLIQARDEARSAVEDRLMKEMERLQEKSNRELEQIRTHGRDVRGAAAGLVAW